MLRLQGRVRRPATNLPGRTSHETHSPPRRPRSLGLALLVCSAAVPADEKDKKEAPVVPPRAGKSETIKLFNGKDLDGWVGHKDLWSVKDGVIVGKNTEPVKVSTYLLTKKKFTDFRLTAKVKLVESEMHSGIAFWGRNAPEHGRQVHLRRPPRHVPVRLGHVRPVRPQRPARRRRAGQEGRQAARLERPGDPRPGQPRPRGGQRRRRSSTGATPSPNRIKDGPIGLQLHSNKVPQEVHFKDLTLDTFPKEDKLTTVKSGK